MSALTPREIAEFVYAEHSPLASMSMEDTIDNIEKKIKDCCEDYHKQKIAELAEWASHRYKDLITPAQGE